MQKERVRNRVRERENVYWRVLLLYKERERQRQKERGVNLPKEVDEEM